MFDIQEELKKLPGKPGVYIMHDEKDAIIYVGKAVSLKNRVRQYFQASRNKGAKIDQMVTRIRRFEYIVTDSELEALVLECNLIKEHRPKYNTMLKDDKTYPFIKVTVNEDYPRILFSRSMKKDKSRYFGPYTSAGAVKDTIELLRKVYKIRSCQRNLPKDIGKERPCLNYHIKQCQAPCQGYISREGYRKNVSEAMDFLNGNYEPIMKLITERMNEAAENLEFEAAIEQRELLNSVKQVAQKQKITVSDGEDKDIIGVDIQDTDAVVQLFFVRDGRIIGRDHFFLRVAPQDTESDIVGSFLTQFYAGTPFIPKEIMLPCEVGDEAVISDWLSAKRGAKVYLRVPKKGTKEKLVELAGKNAAMILSQDKDRMKKEEGRTIGAMKEIAEWLHLSELTRVEAYDISNFAGQDTVGSMIVFVEGQPKKSDYRKFRIACAANGQDDYASMREMLTRRVQRYADGDEKFAPLPNAFMIDGGLGHVRICKEVLDSFGLSVPCFGMVKDDHHRTRALIAPDGREFGISATPALFALVGRMQEEVHRFAIEYNRKLGGKRVRGSTLDRIPGVGDKRRTELLRHFGSVENIRHAEENELARIVPRNTAKEIYDFFHKEG